MGISSNSFFETALLFQEIMLNLFSKLVSWLFFFVIRDYGFQKGRVYHKYVVNKRPNCTCEKGVLTEIPPDEATCMESIFMLFSVDQRVQIECQTSQGEAGRELSLPT